MVDSPCIAACKLNAEKVCIGCYRHIDEIALWNRLTDGQKQQVLTLCQSRAGQLTNTMPVSVVSAAECQAAKLRQSKGEAQLPIDPAQS